APGKKWTDRRKRRTKWMGSARVRRAVSVPERITAGLPASAPRLSRFGRVVVLGAIPGWGSSVARCVLGGMHTTIIADVVSARASGHGADAHDEKHRFPILHHWL